jgi:hypothetical protein
MVIAAGLDGVAGAIVNWPSNEESAESSSRRSKDSLTSWSRERRGRDFTSKRGDWRSRQRAELVMQQASSSARAPITGKGRSAVKSHSADLGDGVDAMIVTHNLAKAINWTA